MDFYTIIGLAGVVGYVSAYGLLQFGMLDGNGVRYSVANVIAASLVLISLTSDFNLASAVIQVIWITVGIAGLGVRLFRRRSSLKRRIESAARSHVVHRRPTAAVQPAQAAIALTSAPHRRPFRVAPGVPRRRGLNLRPDVAPSAGRITMGVRADLAPTSAEVF